MMGENTIYKTKATYTYCVGYWWYIALKNNSEINNVDDVDDDDNAITALNMYGEY